MRIKQSKTRAVGTVHVRPVSGILSFFSGLLLIIPFVSNYNLWFFAWCGFVPLFLAIENQSKIKSFLLAYLTGIVFWSGTIYWLIHVTLPGMLLLVLYLALYFAFFGFLIKIITGTARCAPTDFLFIPSFWVVLEYIRSQLFTGFPWALLGYSQYRNLPVIQIADITGVWGVSFLVMLSNVVIYSGYRAQGTGRSKIKKLFSLLLAILIILVYGYYRISESRPLTPEPQKRISIIQPNIPQELKWDNQARDYIIDQYLKQTSEAVKTKPDLIIWPEASLPVVLEEEPKFFERVRCFVKENNLYLLLGLVRSENDNYYNSAALISKTGQVLNIYDKVHLVPFGEYIPLRNILPFLEALVPVNDFTAGKEYTVFRLPDPHFCAGTPDYRLSRNSGIPLNFTSRAGPITFSVLICFEDVFPYLSRNFTLKGADFLVNITNDAWFKKTSEPYQHLHASVFRAVENRLNVLRSANTGISTFISPYGEIISKVKDDSDRDIFVHGFATQEISIPEKKRWTFYTRFGDVFVWLCLGIIMVWLCLELFRRRVLPRQVLPTGI